MHGTAEQRVIGFVDVLGDEQAEVVDDRDGIQVTFPLGIAPGEQSMTAKHNPVAISQILDRTAEHHGQLEPGPLPGNPAEAMTEAPVELLHPVAAVSGSCERNAPVGVQVVDMREG